MDKRNSLVRRRRRQHLTTWVGVCIAIWVGLELRSCHYRRMAQSPTSFDFLLDRTMKH
ncbi:MAG: hypothetical protein WC052_01610 [Patescibacteria group bacterium]